LVIGPSSGIKSWKREEMVHIKTIYDLTGETPTIYWDDPEHEEIREVISQSINLMNDA
jgi:hypothetical protein